MSLVLDGTTGASKVSATSAQFLVSQVCFFARETAPDGFLKCNGAAVSRTAYADLFAAIGTTYGAGDGSTTFLLPDLRGEFIRGWADGRAVDTGRAFGTFQDQAFASHTHTSDSQLWFGSRWTSSYTSTQIGADVTIGHKAATINSTGGTETRPRNVALLACIKY